MPGRSAGRSQRSGGPSSCPRDSGDLAERRRWCWRTSAGTARPRRPFSSRGRSISRGNAGVRVADHHARADQRMRAAKITPGPIGEPGPWHEDLDAPLPLPTGRLPRLVSGDHGGNGRCAAISSTAAKSLPGVRLPRGADLARPQLAKWQRLTACGQPTAPRCSAPVAVGISRDSTPPARLRV